MFLILDYEGVKNVVDLDTRDAGQIIIASTELMICFSAEGSPDCWFARHATTANFVYYTGHEKSDTLQCHC